MLDADSVIAPGSSPPASGRCGRGVDAVQARSESKPRHDACHGGRAGSVRAAGDHAPARPRPARVLGPAARDRHGVRREIALAHRFRAPASEDLVFTLDLLLDGVRCRHVDSAPGCAREGASRWGDLRRSEAPLRGRTDGRCARLRAEAAAPRASATAIRASLEAAWFLATPPFALAVALTARGAGASPRRRRRGRRADLRRRPAGAGRGDRPRPDPGEGGARTWFALLAAPWYLAWKARRPAPRPRERAPARRLLPADRTGLSVNARGIGGRLV